MKKGMPATSPRGASRQLLAAYQEREVFRPFRVYTFTVLDDVAAKYACHAVFVLRFSCHN